MTRPRVPGRPKGQARVQEKTDDTLHLRTEESIKSHGYFQEMHWRTGSLMPQQVLWVVSQGERKTGVVCILC